MKRPLIAVPGRFASSTSALRYAAIVNARALLTMIHTAGGESVTLLPWPDADLLPPHEVAQRLSFADGLLLPGGGDIDPERYGEQVRSDSVYDVDQLQDSMDLALARTAISTRLPTLAVCRGMHVVNVAFGGTLVQHMDEPHRGKVSGELVHAVHCDPAGWPTGVTPPAVFEVSCYHHQRLATLAPGLEPVATASDGTVEAVSTPDPRSWFLGVQWHPEDRPADDAQQALVSAFVDAARHRGQ